MRNLLILKTTTCAAALLFPATAMADVTADDVWTRISEALAVYGSENMTMGAPERSGSTLTIPDLAFSFEDETSGGASATIGTIVLEEQGDGTVSVAYPENIPMTITAVDSFTDEVTEIEMAFLLEGSDIVASGDPGAITFDFTADLYELDILSIVVEGEAIEGDFTMSATGIVGQSTVTPDGGQRFDYDATIDTVAFDFLFPNPDNPDQMVSGNGTIDAMQVVSSGVIPESLDMSDPEAFARDFYGEATDLTAQYSLGSARYEMSGTGNMGAFDAVVTSVSSGLDMAITGGTISYSGGAEDIAINVEGDQIPFPVEVSLAEYDYGIEMPVAETEEARDLGLRVNLSELVLSDPIWNIFDPGEVLPRDPLSVLLDLSGRARLDVSFVDPEAMASIGPGEAPGELESLSLDALRIAGGGAEITGEGAFTFDNENPSPQFGGMPQPEGQVSFVATGVNSLMDNLVQMGLLPPDQVMGARMMMGMFATATGDDELSSTIEINDQGHVIANGQRIQ